MGLVCSGEPVPEDPRYNYNARHWESSMMNTPCSNCPAFVLGCLPISACCCAFYLRRKALNDNMQRYRCCQGYFCPECCTTCDQSAPDCPNFCLCLETTLCFSCAVSSTRIFVQDERQIVTDPCDNRIIRFNNCMQILRIVCNCLAIFIADLREAARIIDNIGEIIYWLTIGCMQAQTHLELSKHPTVGDYGGVITAPPKFQSQPQIFPSTHAPPISYPPPQAAFPPVHGGYQTQPYENPYEYHPAQAPVPPPAYGTQGYPPQMPSHRPEAYPPRQYDEMGFAPTGYPPQGGYPPP